MKWAAAALGSFHPSQIKRKRLKETKLIKMLRVLANEALETRVLSQLGFKFAINKTGLSDAIIRADTKDQVRETWTTESGNLPSLNATCTLRWC